MVTVQLTAYLFQWRVVWVVRYLCFQKGNAKVRDACLLLQLRDGVGEGWAPGGAGATGLPVAGDDDFRAQWVFKPLQPPRRRLLALTL